MQLRLIVTVAASAFVAAAVTAAPTAVAAPTPYPRLCASGGAGNICQSPGNVEINAPRHAVQFYPYGSMPYLLGGH